MTKRRLAGRLSALLLAAIMIFSQGADCALAESVTEGAVPSETTCETTAASEDETNPVETDGQPEGDTDHAGKETTEESTVESTDPLTEHTTECSTEHTTECSTEHTTEWSTEHASEQSTDPSMGLLTDLTAVTPQLTASANVLTIDETHSRFEGDLIIGLVMDENTTLAVDMLQVTQTAVFPEGTLLPSVHAEGRQVVDEEGRVIASAMADTAVIEEAKTMGTELTVKVRGEKEASLEDLSLVLHGSAIPTGAKEPEYYPVDDQQAVPQSELLAIDQESLEIQPLPAELANTEDLRLANEEAAQITPDNGENFSPEEISSLPEGYILEVNPQPTEVEEGAQVQLRATAVMEAQEETVSLQASRSLATNIRKAPAAFAQVTDITKIRTNASLDKEKKLIWDDSYGKKYGSQAYGDVRTGCYEATLTLKDGTKKSVWMYCLEPDTSDPGDKTFDITNAKVTNVANDSLMAKIFYYGYGGPAWGNTMNGVDIKALYESYGAKKATPQMLINAYLLAKAEGSKRGLSGIDNHLSSAGIKMINAIAEKIDALPEPGATLSSTSLSSTIVGGNAVSSNVTYRSSGVSATVTIPAGDTLVTSDGKRMTGTATIPGICTFHLERGAERTAVTQKLTIRTDVPEECTVLHITTGASVQKTALGYYAGTKVMELAVTFAAKPVEPPACGPIQIKKEDVSGLIKCGSGYSFQIIVKDDLKDQEGNIREDAAGKVYKAGTIAATIVTSANGIAVSGKLYPGTYIIREAAISSLEGLTKSADEVQVTLKEAAGEPVTVTWKDEPNEVVLTKTDQVDGSVLAGVSFDVINQTTGKVRQGLTDDEGVLKLDHLEPGSYRVRETATVPGYNLPAEDSATFVVDANGMIGGVRKLELHLENQPNLVTIHKYDLVEGEEGEELPGASLCVRDSDGKVVDEWVSGTEDYDGDGKADAHRIKALPAGEYQLEETLAPEGYELRTERVTFTVTDSLEVQKVSMGNSPLRDLEISKKALVRTRVEQDEWSDGQELTGAHMEITNSQGELVEGWISGLDENGQPRLDEKGQALPHSCKLPTGDYVLTETLPAPGYATAESVAFHVERREQQGDYQVQKVVMKDKPTVLQITKNDITDGKPVMDAVLTLRDSHGNEVDSWVTTDQPHYIQQLTVGEYSLTEETAPEGYLKAETMTFMVKDTGEIQKVEMLDQPIPEVKGVKTPEKTKETEKTTAASKGAPKTGDSTPLEWCMALMLTALCVFTVLLMKRRNRH